MRDFCVGEFLEIEIQQNYILGNTLKKLMKELSNKESQILMLNVLALRKDAKEFTFPYCPEDMELPSHICSMGVLANSHNVTIMLDEVICRDLKAGDIWSAYYTHDSRVTKPSHGKILFTNLNNSEIIGFLDV